MEKLTHFDENGRAVMVDVSEKENSQRKAVASGLIVMNETAFQAVRTGDSKKGDVLGVARVAGIMASKRCAEMIPLCHSVSAENTSIEFILHPDKRAVEAMCTVFFTGKTGVEMEALCGVNIALLTVYDMCKAVDRGMTLQCIRLLEKQGGQSGHYLRHKD